MYFCSVKSLLWIQNYFIHEAVLQHRTIWIFALPSQWGEILTAVTKLHKPFSNSLSQWGLVFMTVSFPCLYSPYSLFIILQTASCTNHLLHILVLFIISYSGRCLLSDRSLPFCVLFNKWTCLCWLLYTCFVVYSTS